MDTRCIKTVTRLRSSPVIVCGPRDSDKTEVATQLVSGRKKSRSPVLVLTRDASEWSTLVAGKKSAARLVTVVEHVPGTAADREHRETPISLSLEQFLATCGRANLPGLLVLDDDLRAEFRPRSYDEPGTKHKHGRVLPPWSVGAALATAAHTSTRLVTVQESVAVPRSGKVGSTRIWTGGTGPDAERFLGLTCTLDQAAAVSEDTVLLRLRGSDTVRVETRARS